MRLNLNVEERLPKRNQKKKSQILERIYITLSICHTQVQPNIFKLLKHVNKDIKESANINPGPRKDTF